MDFAPTWAYYCLADRCQAAGIGFTIRTRRWKRSGNRARWTRIRAPASACDPAPAPHAISTYRSSTRFSPARSNVTSSRSFSTAVTVP